MFSDDDAAAIETQDDFVKNKDKLRSIRIRQVTGGGNFSSDTKAKFTLSIPVKMRYEVGRRPVPMKFSTRMVYNPSLKRWVPQTVTTGGGFVADTEEILVKTITVFHPCPIRIENTQYDAVLTLNDPADSDTRAVILVPLKGANIGSPSTDFFTKILKHVTSISTPDSLTGLYQGAEIPTGTDWNLKNVFAMGDPDANGVAPVANAYFTWTAAPTYRRIKQPDTATEIRYGWTPDGQSVRYFMLQYPASINLTDLSILTRNLPATPAEKALHTIPDPAMGNPKILYKKSEGLALQRECGITSRESFVDGGVREHMETMNALDSLWSSGGDLSALKGADGTSLTDATDKCDPFALNAQSAKSMKFSPSDAVTFVLNFLILVSVAIGVWLALWSVTKDYDGSYSDFATNAGKVLGTIALRSTNQIGKVGVKEEASPVEQSSIPGSNLLGRLTSFGRKA
jgi:hypothetical protein